MLSSLVEIYAKQVLGPNSDLVRSVKVVEANNVLMKEMAAVASGKTVDSKTISHEHVPVQTIPCK